MSDSPEILTKRLALLPYRKPTVNLLHAQYRWLRDPEVVKYSEQRHTKITRWECKQYIQSFDQQTSFLWAILDKHVNGSGAGPWEDYYLGHLAAYGEPANKSFEMAILIGEKEVWGRGLGLEAWSAAADWLLEQGARKLYAGTMAPNVGMLKIFGKSGFQTEGRRKDHFLLDDKPVDMICAARFHEDSTPITNAEPAIAHPTITRRKQPTFAP